MKRLLIYMLTGASLMGTSCSDFLDTIPRDALSPSTTWQTEEDAQKFLVGCYDGWVDDSAILYWDCGSDFGYNNFIYEGRVEDEQDFKYVNGICYVIRNIGK